MHIRFIFAIVLFLICGIKAPVGIEELFQFGQENGDKELEKGNQSSHIYFEPPLRFFGELYDFAIVQSQGEIWVQDQYILPFRASIDTRKGGNIFSRLSRSHNDLKKAKHEVASAFPAFDDIVLKWVLIVTWYKVMPFNNLFIEPNTFQAAVMTDGEYSFVIYYYCDIHWYESNGTYALSGFMNSVDGYYHPHEIRTIEYRTNNLGSHGKWLYRIDLRTIIEPGMMCPKITQLINGFCYASEYTPEATANCGCNEGYSQNTTTLICNDTTENGIVWLGSIPNCVELETSGHGWIFNWIFVVAAIVAATLLYFRIKEFPALILRISHFFRNSSTTEVAAIYFHNIAEENYVNV